MTFIEPALWWGALAVAIPIAIHFWHQKRGKPLPWAATRWLTERDRQQSRGLRLDNLLLLLVRCLLLLVLVALLAQPLVKWLADQPATQRVHLVQPSAVVADNFRFELAEARRKGEPVYWANKTPELMTDAQPASVPKPEPFGPLTLQTAINQFPHDKPELHLYAINTPALATVPAITVPNRFHLHTVVDSSARPRPFLLVAQGKKLFVNRAGVLTSSAAPDASLPLQAKPVHSGAVRTGLDYRNARERQTVRAALNALTDVYGLDLIIDEKPIPSQRYDWMLTDRVPTQPNPQTLYVVSGAATPSLVDNVVYTNEVLTPQTSARVAGGQLPEWLGEQLIGHFALNPARPPLPQRTLNALFVASTAPDRTQQAGVQDALTLLFIVLIVIERGIALTRNA